MEREVAFHQLTTVQPHCQQKSRRAPSSRLKAWLGQEPAYVVCWDYDRAVVVDLAVPDLEK